MLARDPRCKVIELQDLLAGETAEGKASLSPDGLGSFLRGLVLFVVGGTLLTPFSCVRRRHRCDSQGSRQAARHRLREGPSLGLARRE